MSLLRRAQVLADPRVASVVGILAVLVVSLLAFRFAAPVTPLLALVPIAVWGAVGWALQVPQQNDLPAARGEQGGPVGVALNESALHLGSAIGSGLGGAAFAFGWSGSVLPFWAAGFAVAALLLQLTAVRAAAKRAAVREGRAGAVREDHPGDFPDSSRAPARR